MCLAVPAKIMSQQQDAAEVDLAGNRVNICTMVVPDAKTGDWVLVHAGFAIARIDEEQARRTWETLKEIGDEDLLA